MSRYRRSCPTFPTTPTIDRPMSKTDFEKLLMQAKLDKLEQVIHAAYVRKNDPNPHAAAKFQLELFVISVLKGREKHTDLLIDDEILDWEKVK